MTIHTPARKRKNMDVQCELLETVRILMDESGLTLAELVQLTGIDKSALLRLRKTTRAPTAVNVETLLDALGYEIVVRRQRSEKVHRKRE